eukprot:CAMPEP_0113308748 /NCGR_PEP_ID=MMETSP0010_2-20120614/7074_1 /TAXON_ID=216773 ORGANISM="Corethron hystrix, Strain 308" /NCGR_SAMPLE_ID=MMETSP0010_2 /ASSEMBLY_ACC=CAM_ASM_000155 /LENGTH=53 /DNA_ID=CAMNT_0000163875 /DNA_START=461 /DNA_END=622 /DNA_ORIENTATION=+ /assembly_acc=CAM_ASM_000155
MPNAPVGADPLVFFHGVGGAVPYVSLVEERRQTGGLDDASIRPPPTLLTLEAR